MIGAFQYFFIEKGLFWESFLTVWLHGTIEISCIILAGGAGIVLGKGLIFPGTLSRLQSFQFSALRGLKLFIGITPLIVFAALIESFITRYTEVNELLKGGIILASAAFVTIYFVWYPWKKSREAGERDFEDIELPKKQYLNTNLDGSIKNNSEIFRETFLLYKTHLVKLFKSISFYTGLYLVAIYFMLSDNLIYRLDAVTNSTYQEGLALVFDYEYFPWLGLVNSVLFSFPIHITFWILIKTYQLETTTGFKTVFRRHYFKSLLLALSLNSFILLSALLPDGLSFLVNLFVYSFLVPVLIMTIFVSIKEQKNLLRSFNRSWLLIKHKFWKLQGLLLLLTILGLVLYFFINSPISLYQFYTDIIQWNLSFDEQTMQYVLSLFNILVSIMSLLIAIPLFIIVISILYYSLTESMDAKYLKERIAIFNKL